MKPFLSRISVSMVTLPRWPNLPLSVSLSSWIRTTMWAPSLPPSHSHSAAIYIYYIQLQIHYILAVWWPLLQPPSSHFSFIVYYISVLLYACTNQELMRGEAAKEHVTQFHPNPNYRIFSNSSPFWRWAEWTSSAYRRKSGDASSVFVTTGLSGFYLRTLRSLSIFEFTTLL